MSLTIELEPETEARLRSEAKREGQALERYAANLLREALERTEETRQNAFSLPQALEAMRNRTPAQTTAARERVLERSRRAKPLPPGKTLEEVVAGQWPGAESDAEINAALDDLS